MNKPASTYVIIAHFTESGDFCSNQSERRRGVKEKEKKHQGTFKSVLFIQNLVLKYCLTHLHNHLPPKLYKQTKPQTYLHPNVNKQHKFSTRKTLYNSEKGTVKKFSTRPSTSAMLTN